MRYLSLFSGIEAASVAWHGPPLNWTPVGFAEVEPFPCAVLKHHYPEVPNLGDVTAADFVDRAKALGPVDMVRFAFPNNGYDPDQHIAAAHLTVGAEYTVAATEVGSWSTAVYLAEVSGLRFNSVLFEDVP